MTERQRFGHERRLLTPAQYKAVFDQRQTVRGEHLVLHFRIRPDDGKLAAPMGPARLGLVIPKKQARRAVWRNAIKRQIREAFRHCGKLPPGVDVVARLTKALNGNPAAMAERAELRHQAEQLLDKLVRRCGPVTSPSPVTTDTAKSKSAP